MTTAAPTDSPAEARPASPAQPCPECDPGLLDSLPCAAKGIEARAQYNKDHEEALGQARTQYDGARKAYTTARTGASPLVTDARQQLEKLLEQLDCMIGDPHTIKKLERAWKKVRAELKAHDKWGCYLTTDCNFDDDIQDCLAEDLPSRIADIERRVGEAEDFFTVLTQEPANLTDRVTKAQAGIADIDAKVKAGPAPEDLPELYAAALVAQLHLDVVWGGWRDVNQYMDCLCGALTCSFRGHAAISELTQRLAVEDCRQQSAADYLTQLRENTAQAVMAEYLRVSAAYGDGAPQPSNGGYGEDEPEDDGYGGDQPPDGDDRDSGPSKGGYGAGGSRPPDHGHGDSGPQDGGHGGDQPPDGGVGDGGQENQGGYGGQGRNPGRGRNGDPEGRGGYGRQGSRHGNREGSGSSYRDQPRGSQD
jgi:hypothetical protein